MDKISVAGPGLGSIPDLSKYRFQGVGAGAALEKQ